MFSRATLDALRRKPIFLLWIKECRGAIVALCVHALFMTVVLGPLVRTVVPRPKTYLGIIRASHDSYPDVMAWLDLLLWPAAWALAGAYAKSRVRPALERARRESEALSAAADQAARNGDPARSMQLRSQAEALAPEGTETVKVSDARIRLLEPLGRGAMGTVYLGEDVVLGRRVAVKELAGPLANVPEAQERFVREARALAQISSPYVVQVFDLYREGDRQFLTMELCEGDSLAERLGKTGRLQAKDAARLGAQIAEALAAAHARGVVHRDLKPANVLFSGDDIKVADFGLARIGDSAMTHEGAVMGTPFYMAPEQTRGASVDARADLYALGCVLFEMLSGRPPYTGTVREVLLAHASPADPPALDGLGLDVPGTLCALVAGLLAKEPAGRPGTAREIAASLHAIARELSLPRAA